MPKLVTDISNFFDHPFFIIVGGISTALMVIAFLWTAFLQIKGTIPVWYRLAKGLAKRKVAVFADTAAFSSLKATLTDSGIFDEKNITHIEHANVDRAKDHTLYLVDWNSFGDRIDEIFAARRGHHTSVVIYASPGSIPQETMASVANKANTVVVNFRGRLLNDILTSLITSKYVS